jgi:hypothetical protein
MAVALAPSANAASSSWQTLRLFMMITSRNEYGLPETAAAMISPEIFLYGYQIVRTQARRGASRNRALPMLPPTPLSLRKRYMPVSVNG